MRLIALVMGFLLLLSAIHADTTASYTQDGLLIERTMQIRPINSISTTTGALRALNGTIITLSVTNRGPSDRHNLTLEEDITYLPSYIRIIYSIKPSQTDGRRVLWNVGDLPAGSRFEVSFSLPTPVSDAAVESAKPPTVRSARPPAEIIVPNIVDRGQTVVLRLTTPDGVPINDAQVELISPGGIRSSGTTDAMGRFVFVADQAGYYTYSIPDFTAGAIPATESRVPVVVTPPTTGAITPVSNASSSTPLFSFDALIGLWPLVGGLLIIGLLAFGIYSYFNRPSDDSPTAPAPAFRPPVRDGDGMTPTASPSSTVPDASASMPSSTRTAPSPPSSTSFGASNPQVVSQTRGLLAARRAAKNGDDAPQNPASSGTSADTDDEESQTGKHPGEFDFSSKPRYSEETTAILESGNLSDSGNEGKDENETEHFTSDETEESGDSSDSSGSPPPSWMTHEALNGERAEVDDEAITKTISELEALRSELKNRASARAASGEEQFEPSSQSGQSSRERHLKEAFNELGNLGQEMDNENTQEASDDSQVSSDILSQAAEPEASDEEITQSIAPEEIPTVSEAAAADERGEGGEGEEQGAQSYEPQLPEAEEAPRIIMEPISISPIPPRMSRVAKRPAKQAARRSPVKTASAKKKSAVSQGKKTPAAQKALPAKRAPAKKHAAKSKKR